MKNKTEHKNEHEEENIKQKLVFLSSGVLFFALSFVLKKLELSQYYYWCSFGVSYAILSFEVALKAVKNLFKGFVFDENFLMFIATVGAILIKEYNEAVFVMLFYNIGELAQDFAVDRSKDKIKNLVNIAPSKARKINADGTVSEIDLNEIKIDDRLIVLTGEIVPVDGLSVSSSSQLDTRSVTGESVPKVVYEGSVVLSGSVVLEAPLTFIATSNYCESTLNKILILVKNAQDNKAPAEKFITKFAKVYTPAVIVLALLFVISCSVFTGQLYKWIHRALVFLVISCPCALVLSVPLAFFAGIGTCASKGILVKGGACLENLAKTDCFVFDKTGTLTTGEFNVKKIIAFEPFSDEDVLFYAYNLELYSNHPIAKAITKSFVAERNTTVKNVREMNGKGICGEINGNQIVVGNEKIMKSFSIQTDFDTEYTADSVVYVAINGIPAGKIAVGDTLKEEAFSTIENLKNSGVKKIVILSGDTKERVKFIADELKADESFGSLLPHRKVEKLKNFMKTYKCAFVGDGINDSPVLMQADCSIAMGKTGSAGSIDASDIVITNDDLSKIFTAFKCSHKVLKLAKLNIVFALSAKAVCLLLGALGFAGMNLAVLADTGVALLCVANSMRAFKLKK